MFKSKIVQIRKCSILKNFKFKNVQNSKSVHFLKIVQFRKSVQIKKKTETKTRKLRKNGLEIEKRLEQVKTQPEYSKRFLKPENKIQKGSLIEPAQENRRVRVKLKINTTSGD
jgi:hypothetical protein